MSSQLQVFANRWLTLAHLNNFDKVDNQSCWIEHICQTGRKFGKFDNIWLISGKTSSTLANINNIWSASCRKDWHILKKMSNLERCRSASELLGSFFFLLRGSGASVDVPLNPDYAFPSVNWHIYIEKGPSLRVGIRLGPSLWEAFSKFGPRWLGNLPSVQPIFMVFYDNRWFFENDFLVNIWVWISAKVRTFCRFWKILQNVCFALFCCKDRFRYRRERACQKCLKNENFFP